jgi:hypothetical protein
LEIASSLNEWEDIQNALKEKVARMSSANWVTLF